MTPARFLLARLLAASTLVLPSACTEESASPAAQALAGAGGATGTGGNRAGGSAGTTPGGGAGGSGQAGTSAGTGGTSPCGNLPPPPPPTTQTLCYAPAALAPASLSFCRGSLGTVRVVCDDGATHDAPSFPPVSPCESGGQLQKNCPKGLVFASASPWVDPCGEKPSGSAGAGAGGKGAGASDGSGGAGAGAGAGGSGGVGASVSGGSGGAGAGGSSGGGGMAGGKPGDAGAPGGGGAPASGGAGGASAATGGTGGNGGATDPSAAPVCGRNVGATQEDFGDPTFLACLGVAIPPMGGGGPTGQGSMVSYGPLLASEEGGAAKCCHVVTTTYFGQLCGRPLVRESAPVVATLVRGADAGWAA